MRTRGESDLNCFDVLIGPGSALLSDRSIKFVINCEPSDDLFDLKVL